MTDDLARRVADLDRIREITALKYRYWAASDDKDPAAFRACFVRGAADIDYGPLGRFADADQLVRVFTDIALRKIDGGYAVLDMHHGLHPLITVVSETEATGEWTLHFRQLDLVHRTERLSSGTYRDRYLVEDGQWRIAASIYRPRWTLQRPLGADATVIE